MVEKLDHSNHEPKPEDFEFKRVFLNNINADMVGGGNMTVIQSIEISGNKCDVFLKVLTNLAGLKHKILRYLENLRISVSIPLLICLNSFNIYIGRKK